MPNESHFSKILLKTSSVFGLLSQLNSNFSTPSFEKPNNSINSQEVEIHLMNNKTITINITKNTKACELCREIASQINLVSYLDFKLFVQISNNEERRLEDDEFLFRVFTNELQENSSKNSELTEEFVDSGDETRSKSPNKSKITSFFSNIKNSFEKGYNKLKTTTRKLFSSDYKLFFKKYLFFTNEIELLDFNLDQIKLGLVTSQIFHEVFLMNYVLSYNDYCLISALRTYLTYGNMSMIKANDFLHLMEEKSLKESIPDEIFYKKDKEYWVNTVGDNWKSFSEGIGKIVDLNTNLNFEANSAMLKSLNDRKNAKINVNLKPTNAKIIAQLLTIESLAKSELFGAKIFWVNYESAPKKKNKDFGYLAIFFSKISLLDSKKKEMNQVLYENIIDYKTFPDAFELDFDSDFADLQKQRRNQKFLSFSAETDEEKKEFFVEKKMSKEDVQPRRELVSMRFSTANSFEIYQLIDGYYKLREFLDKKME